MKKLYLSLLAIALIFALSCQKSDVTNPDETGNIAGMGNAPGELAVTPFEFPADIVLVGNVAAGVDRGESGETAALVSGNDEVNSTLKSGRLNNIYGSGGKWIKVDLTFNNNSRKLRTIFLPPGLVFKVDKPGYQHGILMQWVWIVIKPNSNRTVRVHLYCINKGKDGSGKEVSYAIAGVTKSKAFKELLDRLGWCKINYEHYVYNSTLKSGSLLKSDENGEEKYKEISDMMQEAVWAVTNGTGLSEEQIAAIEALPVLEEGTYPPNLSLETVNEWDYFDEYGPK